jgi:hypothetical protein
MKKFIAIAAFAALGSLSVATAMAAEWTGYISDTKCAAASSKASSAAEWIKPDQFESCVKQCVKAGSPAVFLTPDNKMIKIDAASMEKVTPMLGHKVTVTGKLDGGVLKIDTIADAK